MVTDYTVGYLQRNPEMQNSIESYIAGTLPADVNFIGCINKGIDTS